MTFQFKLFEGSNTIEVHYATATIASNGGMHSAGIEDPTGTIGLQYYLGTDSLSTPLAIRYSLNTPIANPGGPYSGIADLPVSLDGTGSSDPNNDPLQYNWDFGDGSPVAINAGPTPNHIYSNSGTYTVCLTVTDPDGNSDTACTTAGTPPQAEPQSVTFETLSTDCTGNPVPLQLSLNGHLIGEEVVTPFNCTCTPSVETLTISKTAFTGFFNSGGENTWEFFKASQSWNYVAWASVSFDYGNGEIQRKCLFDVDGGNCDETDLCLAGYTDGEGHGQYVAAVVPSTHVTIVDLNEIINALAPGVFKNSNMQNPLTNKINIALALVAEGNYAGSLGKLQNDILGKIDGCAVSGKPDSNDWITDCASQEQIYPLIMQTIEYVKSMM